MPRGVLGLDFGDDGGCVGGRGGYDVIPTCYGEMFRCKVLFVKRDTNTYGMHLPVRHYQISKGPESVAYPPNQ